MTSFILPAIAVAVGILFIFLNRFVGSNRTVLPISEIALFLTTILIVSITNATGFVLQQLLSKFVQWQSYNIHDLLVGSSVGIIDPTQIIESSMPTTIVISALIISCCHFQRRPLNWIVLSTVAYFVVLTLLDIHAIAEGPKNGAAPLSQDLLANAVGAPFLGLLVTGTYFGLSSIPKPTHSRLMRPAIILLAGLAGTLIEISAFFIAEHVFLDVSSTPAIIAMKPKELFVYPDKKANANTIFQFAIRSSARRVRKSISLFLSQDVNFDWLASSNLNRLALYAAKNCTPNDVELRLPSLRPKAVDFTQFNHLSASEHNKLSWGYVLSPTDNPLFLDHAEPVDPTFEVLKYDTKQSGFTLAEVLSAHENFDIHPMSKHLVFAIGQSDYAQAIHLPVRVRIDDQIIYFNHSDATAATSSRCKINKIFLGEHLQVKSAEKIDALIVVIQQEMKPGTNNDLRLSSSSGYFETGTMSSPYGISDNQLPIQTGLMNLLYVNDASVQKMNLYGQPALANFEGPLTIQGESLLATLSSDGSLSLRGTVTNISTNNDRIMKTTWELMNPEIQIFLLTGMIAIGGFFTRFFFLLLKRNRVGKWLDWKF